MLENLDQQVRECLRRAEESAERAKRAPNPDIRRDFLEMEGRWLNLARNYQFLERLGSFRATTMKGGLNFREGLSNSIGSLKATTSRKPVTVQSPCAR